MANRVVLAWNDTYGFAENIASTDDIDMQGTGQVINLADGYSDGHALAYGQAGASLAGLTLTDTLDMGDNLITNVATPVSSTDAVNMAYVDALLTGLKWKEPVMCIAVADVATLSGLTTVIDDVNLDVDGYRVLLSNQTDATENGIWEIHDTAWTRPTDFDTGDGAANSAVFIMQGTTYADTAWVCTTDTPHDVIGTDELTFVQFSGSGSITAGYGLTMVSNEVRLNPGDGIKLSGDTVYTEVGLYDTNPGLTLIGTSPNKRLAALVASDGGLEITASGIEVKIADGYTLMADTNGLDVTGVPALFYIDGEAVSATVTSANLDDLTDGSDASLLHYHSEGKFIATAADNLTAGQPVYISAADTVDIAQADTDNLSFVSGLNVSPVTTGNPATIVFFGIIPDALSGATAGTIYYLDTSGGITTTLPSLGNIVQVGFALNSTDLFVQIQRFGKRV